MSSIAQSTPRVLSIQSHVVWGYVGNKCATFPLQLLGFEVDTINSVQFSNHTGYKVFKGQILDETQLQDLYDGLEQNDIHRKYKYLLTGYVGSDSFLKRVAHIIQQLKKATPNLLFVCDPVLGDNGQLYVPKENLPIYREMLLPLADILTPNQFEAELLSGIKITSHKDVIEALDYFHGKGIKVVVITSTKFPSAQNENMWGYASQLQTKNGKMTKYQIRFNIPLIDGSFTGSGDLFAALFLAWYDKSGENLKSACEKTASTLHHVLSRTSKAASESLESGSAAIELKLIESKADMENPAVVISAEEINSLDVPGDH